MSSYKFYRFLGRFISINKYRKIIDFFRFYIFGIYNKTDEHHIFLSGAGIAYSLIISLIPFVVLAFSVLGNIIDASTIEAQVTSVLNSIIPYPAYAKYLSGFILKRVPEVMQYKTVGTYVGVFGLLFTSTWIFSSLRTILNKIFNVVDQKNAFIAMLRDFGMVILLLFFILLSTFVLPALKFVVDAADKIELLQVFRLSDMMDSVFAIMSVVVMFIMFWVFFTLIPYAKLGKRVPIVAAFWSTFLWEVARNLFGYYVANFLAITNMYGAFLFIAVLAFWIFYSSCVFILGAIIGQLYRERRDAKEIIKKIKV